MINLFISFFPLFPFFHFLFLLSKMTEKRRLANFELKYCSAFHLQIHWKMRNIEESSSPNVWLFSWIKKTSESAKRNPKKILILFIKKTDRKGNFLATIETVSIHMKTRFLKRSQNVTSQVKSVDNNSSKLVSRSGSGRPMLNAILTHQQSRTEETGRIFE